MNRLTEDVHEFLTTEIIEMLNAKQIFTLNDFLNTNSQQISKITRLTFRDATIIKRHILNKYSSVGRNGHVYYKKLLRNSAIIPTGIPSLDKVLEGGLFTGNIYEICGFAATGKTQLCLSLVKQMVTYSSQQKVYYLDTRNKLSGTKIKSLLNVEIDNEMLSRVLIKKIETMHDLVNSLYEIKDELENGLLLRTVIIDSLPALFFSCDKSQNNGLINIIGTIMNFVKFKYHVSFVVTNLITSWMDGDFRNIGHSTETIACGKHWLAVPNTRLKIERLPTVNDRIKCKISIMSSNVILQKDCNVELYVTDEGLQEACED